MSETKGCWQWQNSFLMTVHLDLNLSNIYLLIKKKMLEELSDEYITEKADMLQV